MRSRSALPACPSSASKCCCASRRSSRSACSQAPAVISAPPAATSNDNKAGESEVSLMVDRFRHAAGACRLRGRAFALTGDYTVAQAARTPPPGMNPFGGRPHAPPRRGMVGLHRRCPPSMRQSAPLRPNCALHARLHTHAESAHCDHHHRPGRGVRHRHRTDRPVRCPPRPARCAAGPAGLRRQADRQPARHRHERPHRAALAPGCATQRLAGAGERRASRRGARAGAGYAVRSDPGAGRVMRCWSPTCRATSSAAAAPGQRLATAAISARPPARSRPWCRRPSARAPAARWG